MAITASDVQKLREQTGAGMMDCKKALEESNGDNEKANEILRKKGLAAAAKRAGKSAAEGLVHCYIHSNAKIGVLIEVNCETDFAARSDAFKDLCKELSMQVAAANPRWVRREEIPAAIIEKEREIYRDQAKATGKPEKVIEKIAEGKLEKFFQDFCLVDQVYIKDDKRKVKDLINDAVGKIRENLVVRRYARFQVGEQLAAEPAPQE